MRNQQICFFLAIASLYWAATSQQDGHHNVADWARSRHKRHLIFPNLGVQKFVASISVPVPLHDKRMWRSFTVSWAFQWVHTVPTTVLYWWNSTYYPAHSRANGRAILPTVPVLETVDLTGTFLYAVIENYYNKGVNGRECMMRSICENAQVNLVGGLLDRLYRRFLTPEKAMEQYYKDAFAVGERGADCHKTYPNCPRGKSFFDRFVNIHEVD